MQVLGKIEVRGEVKIENVTTHNSISQAFKTYLINGFNGVGATPQSFAVALPQLGVTLQNPKITVSTTQTQTVSGTYIKVTFFTITLTFTNTQPLSGVISYSTLYLITNSGTVRVADTTLPQPLSVAGQFVVTWTLSFVWAEPVVVAFANLPIPGYPLPGGVPIAIPVPSSAVPNLQNIANIIGTLIVPNAQQYGITPVTFASPYITTDMSASSINSVTILGSDFFQVTVYYIVSQPVNTVNALLSCDGVTVLQVTINQLYQYNETALITFTLGISFM